VLQTFFENDYMFFLYFLLNSWFFHLLSKTSNSRGSCFTAKLVWNQSPYFGYTNTIQFFQ